MAFLGAALLAVGVGCPGGNSANDTVTVGIVTSPALPAGTVGRLYSVTLQASGLTPQRWDLTAGSLPAGLLLDNATGTISGTPTTFLSAAAPATFTITLTDTGGAQYSQTFAVSVAVGPVQTLDAAPFLIADSAGGVVARLGGVAFNGAGATPQFVVAWDDTTNAATTGRDAFRRALGTNAVPLAAGGLVVSPAPAGAQAFPSIAFDNLNAQYLVAWAHDDGAGTRGVRGALLDAALAVVPAGAAPCPASVLCISTTGAPVTTEQTAAAYSATSQQYLVAWQDATAPSLIKGRRLTATGAPVDATDITLSTDGTVENLQPAVAWDGATNQYLVVWSQWNGAGGAATLSAIRGRFVSSTAATGAAAGAAFDVSPAVAVTPAVRQNPSVTYNTVSRRYVIVWSEQEASNSTEARIAGQVAQANGALELPQPFSPQGAVATSLETNPVVLAGADGIGLLVWVSNRTAGNGLDLFAATLDVAGNIGPETGLIMGVDQGTLVDQAEPRLAYDTANKRWLCAFGSFNSFAAPGTSKIEAVRVLP